MRIDQIKLRYKLIIIIFILIPLLMFVLFDMVENSDKTSYVKCNNEIIKLNKTKTYNCGHYTIEYSLYKEDFIIIYNNEYIRDEIFKEFENVTFDIKRYK